MNEEEARAFALARGDARVEVQLTKLISELQLENGRQNLVAEKSLEEVWNRHIADSAQLLDHVPRETTPWLDLGTGAGFPGIVIAALRPQVQMVLVESRRKRVEWLARMISSLGLDNCRVEGCRVETLPTFEAAVISARAFAPLPRLIDLSARFSTKRTRWLLPKGRSAAQEVEQLPKQLRNMFHVEPSATDCEAGIIIGRGRAEVRK